jgi:hypothetical protein
MWRGARYSPRRRPIELAVTGYGFAHWCFDVREDAFQSSFIQIRFNRTVSDLLHLGEHRR